MLSNITLTSGLNSGEYYTIPLNDTVNPLEKGVLKGHPLSFMITVHFFWRSKRDELRKRSPEKTTAPC